MLDLQTLEPVSSEVRLEQFTEPNPDPWKNWITSFALHPDGDRFAISKNYAAAGATSFDGEACVLTGCRTRITSVPWNSRKTAGIC